jgi:hypothetical protein
MIRVFPYTTVDRQVSGGVFFLHPSQLTQTPFANAKINSVLHLKQNTQIMPMTKTLSYEAVPRIYKSAVQASRKLKYPPASKAEFLIQLAAVTMHRKSLKKIILDCPSKFYVFSNLVSAYNIIRRKEKQLRSYGIASGWL